MIRKFAMCVWSRPEGLGARNTIANLQGYLNPTRRLRRS